VFQLGRTLIKKFKLYRGEKIRVLHLELGTFQPRLINNPNGVNKLHQSLGDLFSGHQELLEASIFNAGRAEIHCSSRSPPQLHTYIHRAIRIRHVVEVRHILYVQLLDMGFAPAHLQQHARMTLCISSKLSRL